MFKLLSALCNCKHLFISSMQFIHPSTVDLIASSVENHPSLRELVVEACHINLLVKGVVEGMAKRHGVEKLFVYVPVRELRLLVMVHFAYPVVFGGNPAVSYLIL